MVIQNSMIGYEIIRVLHPYFIPCIVQSAATAKQQNEKSVNNF